MNVLGHGYEYLRRVPNSILGYEPPVISGVSRFSEYLNLPEGHHVER